MDLDLAQSVKCTICLCLMLEPVRLPCDHCFCLPCTRKWQELGTLFCPLCRRRYGAWLRRAERRGQLVDAELAERIRRIAAELASKTSEDNPKLKLSAPGEIRSEYRAEFLKVQKERETIQNEQSKETEKLISELQEKERIMNETRLQELKIDEEYARKLSVTLNSPTIVRENSSASKNTTIQQNTNGLEKKNGFKKQTISNYFEKLNKTTCTTNQSTINAVSPELIPTERPTLKKVCNGSSDNSNKKQDGKLEPQLWDPQLPTPGQTKELSVYSGIVTERKASTSLIKDTQKIVEKAPTKEPKILEPDMRSEDSLKQELCYFKPIHSIPISRFKGKVVKCIPIKIPNSSGGSLIASILAVKTKPLIGFCKNSPFVRLSNFSDIPIEEESDIVIKSPRKKSPNKRNSNKKSSPRSRKNKSNTPLKSSIDVTSNGNSKSKKNGKGPFTCSKLSNGNKRSPAKRIKRSLSFSDTEDCRKKPLNDNKNVNGRTLRSNGNNRNINGFINTDYEDFNKNTTNMNGRLRNRNSKNSTNSLLDSDAEISIEDIDPLIIEEQKKIEAMILQEKKDLLLAKKLQKQMGNGSIYTGYTTRTAVKRQATLTEIMTSKNMRI